ncbi:MAG TPA: cytochrome c biogenesis protein CcsA [Chitinophagaceae bacterium]
MIRQSWWKILAVIFLVYTCTMGFLVDIPRLDDRLQHSIRNLFFHVPMWFGMMILYITSVVYAVKYLRKPDPVNDFYSLEFARTGTVFGVLGLVTGAIWARYQWGAFWSSDPKQNGALIAILIYFAYFVLRGSMNDEDKRARIGAVYNIFAFFMLFPTIWILPRMVESLHPGGQGSEGNPGLNGGDLAPSMRLVFWPAVMGWTLLGVWITTLSIRLRTLQNRLLND